MKWFRFYQEFIEDPKIAMMSDSDQLLWVKALCLASDSKRRGYILLTDEEICWKLRVTMETWKHAIDKFRAKGMVEHCEDGYRICNWDKRQFSSDSSAERVAKHREKKAKKTPKKTPKKAVSSAPETLVSQGVTPCNVTVTPPDPDPDPDPDVYSPLPPKPSPEGKTNERRDERASQPSIPASIPAKPSPSDPAPPVSSPPPRPVDRQAAQFAPRPWRDALGKVAPQFQEFVGRVISFGDGEDMHPRAKGRAHIANLERSGDPYDREKLEGYWDDYQESVSRPTVAERKSVSLEEVQRRIQAEMGGVS